MGRNGGFFGFYACDSYRKMPGFGKHSFSHSPHNKSNILLEKNLETEKKKKDKEGDKCLLFHCG